jgi:hypothetical protein
MLLKNMGKEQGRKTQKSHNIITHYASIKGTKTVA